MAEGEGVTELTEAAYDKTAAGLADASSALRTCRVEDARLIRDLNRDVVRLRKALNECWKARYNADAIVTIIEECKKHVG